MKPGQMKNQTLVNGSKAWVHIEKVNRQKWDPKAKGCRFIGYGTVMSRNVTFNECAMPASEEPNLSKHVTTRHAYLRITNMYLELSN